ncbi:hypothetical protein CCACVL1_03151, partial [Corchorus capsularis]
PTNPPTFLKMADPKPTLAIFGERYR